jgi:hypothetical protein
MRRARGWGVTMGRSTLQRQPNGKIGNPGRYRYCVYGRAGPATAEPQATKRWLTSGQHYVHAHITQERAPSWQHHKSRKHKAWEGTPILTQDKTTRGQRQHTLHKDRESALILCIHIT